MRLDSFLDNYVADSQLLHIECIGVGEIYFDGTKDELSTYNATSEVDILNLWVHLVEAIDDILYITIEY